MEMLRVGVGVGVGVGTEGREVWDVRMHFCVRRV